MIKITTDRKTELGVLDSLKAMTMPKSKRVRMLNAAARSVVKTSRTNQRRQRSPSGTRWQNKKRRGGRKMMAGLSRMMTVVSNNGSIAIVGWKRDKTAQVAYAHHHGIKERVSRAKAIKAQNG